MKYLFLILALGSLACVGCAQRYVITLTGGNQITTAGKPKRHDGYYTYTDTKGRPGQVSAARVREVAPVSMASSPDSTGD